MGKIRGMNERRERINKEWERRGEDRKDYEKKWGMDKGKLSKGKERGIEKGEREKRR